MSADYYLKIDGIDGESKDAIHKGSIELLSWSFGATQPGASGQVGVNADDVKLTHHIDKATPLLMLACAKGNHIPQAILSVRKSAKDDGDFYKVTFHDLVISSFSHAGDGGAVPTDEFSLNFAKISVDYSYVSHHRVGQPISSGLIDNTGGTP